MVLPVQACPPARLTLERNAAPDIKRPFGPIRGEDCPVGHHAMEHHRDPKQAQEVPCEKSDEKGPVEMAGKEPDDSPGQSGVTTDEYCDKRRPRQPVGMANWFVHVR